MHLREIIAISGKPGLYKILTQTRTGFVAESLIDKKRFPVSIRQNVSMLSEIAIYTLEEEVPLQQVFETIKKKEGGKATSISHKDGKDALEEYFFEVLPDFDEDRVYPSDIKKIIQWYNLLQKNDLLDFEAEEETVVDEEE